MGCNNVKIRFLIMVAVCVMLFGSGTCLALEPGAPQEQTAMTGVKDEIDASLATGAISSHLDGIFVEQKIVVK